MPIMANYGQEDARGAAWLLASKTLDCLAQPEIAPEWLDSLNNTYRLLEAYRVNAFFGLPQAPRNDTMLSFATATMTPEREQHLPKVLDALDDSVHDVFVGVSKEISVSSLIECLRSLAYPESVKPQNDLSSRENAMRFFETFIKKLEYV